MVTVETTKDILFALEDCVLCKFIELVSKLLPLPPKIIKFKKPNKEILAYSPTKTYPILKAGDDFITGALPILNYLIKSAKDESDGVILDNRKIILGKNIKEESRVDMWTNYIFSSIVPITNEIESQLYGKKKFNSAIFENALNDLLEVLGTINEQLKLNTFLTSNTIQLADLMLTVVLFHCYNDVLTQEKVEKIPNVIRMFKFVSHMRPFIDIFGEATPCKKRKAPEAYIEPKEEEEKTEQTSKKDKKDKKNKKEKDKK
jgi:glutathione S-transferase